MAVGNEIKDGVELASDRKLTASKSLAKVFVMTLAIATALDVPASSQMRTPPRSAVVNQKIGGDRPAAQVAVPTIAKQVTVRIFAPAATGSGAIVQQQGQTYTVLTCAHIAGEVDARYTVLTADGQTHPARRLRLTSLSSRADLALVQFTSKKAYRVVAIADSKTLAVGDPIYAAGFPNWQWTNSDTVEDTRTWGTKAFAIANGKVAMLPKKSLKEGYQLGYTSDITPGMSGGPVLDRSGELVGINGRLKYPPQGISSFTFTDGSMPSEELFQQMEALSWAIPTDAFRQALK